MLRQGRHHSKHLQLSWNKYGEEFFTHVIIEEHPLDVLLEREQHWIDYYRSYDGKYGYNGTRFVTEGNPTFRKISEEEAIQIIHLAEEGCVRKDIARRFKISPQTVSDICFSRSWGHLARGRIRWNMWRKIPDEELSRIIADAKAGVLQKKIAERYGVNQSTISRIIRNQKRRTVRYADV